MASERGSSGFSWLPLSAVKSAAAPAGSSCRPSEGAAEGSQGGEGSSSVSLMLSAAKLSFGGGALGTIAQEIINCPSVHNCNLLHCSWGVCPVNLKQSIWCHILELSPVPMGSATLVPLSVIETFSSFFCSLVY